jgi:hypothetical protein
MTTRDYIVSRQIQWARRHGIRLGGQFRHSSDPTQVDRGAKTWVYRLEDNLFEPMLPQVRREFEAGDGGELVARDPKRGNMHALQSSSAVACNVFHYWRKRGEPDPIAKACALPTKGLASLSFEVKRAIGTGEFERAPNLDVEFRYSEGSIRAAGIECKFCEPFGGRRHSGLPDRYLTREEWSHYPTLHALARRISPDDRMFAHFHAAQILKHVLGLTCKWGAGNFRLVYLWYDAPGKEALDHAQEANAFLTEAQCDGLRFQIATYQEVIARLALSQRDSQPAYIDYLTERYF